MVGWHVRQHTRSAEFEILSPTHRELDLVDSRSVDTYLAAHTPDIIVHLAAVVGGIQANIRQPFRYLSANLAINSNVIVAARRCGIRRLINIGSSCMYPKNVSGLLREDMILTAPLEPTNEGYALAKIAATKLCQYARSENPQLEYKTFIPCNLYGPHDNFDPSSSHLVASIIRKTYDALDRGANSIDIWGDGEARREFMYAGDLADFIFFAIANWSKVPDLLNVGVGADHTVDDYYQVIAGVVGYTGGFSHDKTKPAGMIRKVMDISAVLELGWRAPTDLIAGLTATCELYEANIKG